MAPTLNPVLRDFWLTPARNRILYGGRASSKSWDAAGFAIFLACNVKLRFLCARQFQNKIAESVYTLLKTQIERFGLQKQFLITDNSIKNLRTGSEFLFYGLWRHIDEIKSLEGIDICWIEEAHNLTKEQWEILEPTVRKQGSQFWIIFNPRLVTDFVWQRFIVNTPPNTVKRHINYTENPFLSDTMLDVIRAAKEEDEDEFNNIYLGVPREDDDQVVIKRSWIMAAIDACKRLGLQPNGGPARIGFDVADSGVDKNAVVMMSGIEAKRVHEWKGREDELLKSASHVYNLAVVEEAEIDYDSIGIGAFAGSQFQALNARRREEDENCSLIKYRGFNAGGAVFRPEQRSDPRDDRSRINKDYYSNVKAQAWWEVAARFRNTYNVIKANETAIRDGGKINIEPYEIHELISIDSQCDHVDKLVWELSTPRRDFDLGGKVKVESKKDLVKRDVPSPNIGDAFIMANSPQPARSWYDPSVVATAMN